MRRLKGLRSAHLSAGIFEPPEYYEGENDGDEDEGDNESTGADED